jgi:hypothetical protein
MFITPYGRIVWKEYRSNRALWLSCLMIGILLQMFVTVWHVYNHSYQYDSAFKVDVVTNCACFMPVMYAIGFG